MLFMFQKPSESFGQDYQSILYYSKTIKICCLTETINVFCFLHSKDHQSLLAKTIKVFFTIPRLSKSVVLKRLSMYSVLYVSKTIWVFCQDYQSLLYFSRTIRVFCQDYQSLLYFSRTTRVFCREFNVSFTFQRLSMSFIETSMSPLLFKASRSFILCTSYFIHLFFWQVSLLGFSLVVGRVARSLGWN